MAHKDLCKYQTGKQDFNLHNSAPSTLFPRSVVCFRSLWFTNLFDPSKKKHRDLYDVVSSSFLALIDDETFCMQKVRLCTQLYINTSNSNSSNIYFKIHRKSFIDIAGNYNQLNLHLCVWNRMKELKSVTVYMWKALLVNNFFVLTPTSWYSSSSIIWNARFIEFGNFLFCFVN